MNIYIKFLLVFLAVVAAFFLQQSGILSLGSINPNLILISFLLIIFKLDNIWFLGALLLSMAAVFFTLTPYWFPQVLVVVVLAIGFYFLKRILTGNNMLDFLIAILLGTVIFYLIINVFRFSLISVGLVLGEVLYNLILGFVIWPIFRFLKE
ncbi:MAG: hypothetical protein KJI72_00960 [Patescibacteria group bacterium]|nr:hypothetical protein [Patescibacteria group bacterium]